MAPMFGLPVRAWLGPWAPWLELVLAAPVTPFVEPFRESARRNVWILGGVTLLVLALATVLTRGTTRALSRLADAAEAVARGGRPRGPERALRMLRAGYALPARVLAYPYPVIAACNGHVLAMGVFLMLSADYIIGSRGDFKIAANEVAIGMTMPRVAAAVMRYVDEARLDLDVPLQRYLPAMAGTDARRSR